MGAVLLGAMAGGLTGVIALFLGAGWWPAFATYVVMGLATTCGVAIAAFLRPETDIAAAQTFAPAEPAQAPQDTMQQWLEDPETQPEDTSDQKVA